MKRIAVLVSGGGTNLQALIDAQGSVLTSGKIALVVSNNAGAYALERAKNAGIDTAVVLKKGIMLVSSGIEFDKYDDAKDEIFRQLEAVKNGDITQEELDTAKRSVASDLRSAMDSQGELEGFWLSQTLEGLDYGPLELAELIEDVTKEDVMSIAESIELDLIYFLK